MDPRPARRELLLFAPEPRALAAAPYAVSVAPDPHDQPRCAAREPGPDVALAIPVIRWYELWALNVRWDTNAYGTAAWLIVGTHTALLLLDSSDTIGLALFYWFKRVPIKTMSDVSDNSLYWYFMVLSWVALYVIVYLGPRWF
jgi:hypothetical protein